MILSQTVRTFFNGGDVATQTMIYNASNSTAATTGWVDVKTDDAVVQINVATLNAATFLYRIEGRFGSGIFNRTACILATMVETAHSIDIHHTIDNRFAEIRVGAKVISATTPNNFYAAVCRTEVK